MPNSLLHLRHLLIEKPVEIIDDELLAEIAGAAAAGEDVDALYANEMKWIESSVPLAEAYGELVEMMETAVFTMNQAAQSVSPRDVYLSLLAERVTLSPEQRIVAGEVVDRLAVLLAEEGVETAVRQAVAPVSETWRERLGEAIRQTGGALALYARGQADALWRKAYSVTAQERDNGFQLQIGFAPQTVPVLHGEEIGDSRLLFSQRVGNPFPYLITIRVERETELTCRLIMQADRADLFDVSGQVVQISYGGRVETAVTDEDGVVETAVPIVILAKCFIQVAHK